MTTPSPLSQPKAQPTPLLLFASLLLLTQLSLAPTTFAQQQPPWQRVPEPTRAPQPLPANPGPTPPTHPHPHPPGTHSTGGNQPHPSSGGGGQPSTPNIHGPGAHGPNAPPPNAVHRLLPMIFRLLSSNRVFRIRWERALRFCPNRPVSHPCKTAASLIVNQLCAQVQADDTPELFNMLCLPGVAAAATAPPPA